MRFATIFQDGRASVAVVRDGGYLPLAVPDPRLGSLRGIAASGADGLAQIRAWVAVQPERAYRSLDDIELGPAVPDPGAIYTIGLNYASPGDADAVVPTRPMVYGKIPTSVTGHGSAVTWDRTLTDNVDAEGELGVVIGEPATAVPPDDAMRHVFGYTVVNDVTARDIQHHWGGQFFKGKSLDASSPVGPWIVTADEISDPQNLRVILRVNGEVKQDGHTRDMIHSVAEIIRWLSVGMTLHPGNLIATGTPDGVGFARTPPEFLKPGDVMEAEVEHVGVLRNRMVAATVVAGR